MIAAAPPEDYFRYLPENRLCAAWGATALSTGFTRIPPRSAYPPVRHPDDHHFDWSRGRVLQAYQFALISAGQGRMQAAPHRDRVVPIRAGDILIMLPGVWHRFAPDPATGWTENWIECSGPAFDALRDRGFLSPERPVWHGGPQEQEIFNQIHLLSRDNPFAHQPSLSTLGLQLLARLAESQRDPLGHETLADRARQILMERSANPPPLEALAQELGVSYSALRRLFRADGGQSLKAFQTGIRMRRACELLRNSDKSVKEIARLLGFSSAFHFSAQFAKEMGAAPSHWRLAASRGVLPGGES